MTDEEYVGKSNALKVELDRVRGILDSAVAAKQRYGVEVSKELIARARQDWANVVKCFESLEQDYWGF